MRTLRETTDAVFDALQAHAQRLNDLSHVEEQWRVLGFADGMNGAPDAEASEDPEYGRHYRAGLDAARRVFE